MAGMAQYLDHVAAAMYRIEAAVRNGLTNFSVPTQQINGFQTTRTFNP